MLYVESHGRDQGGHVRFVRHGVVVLVSPEDDAAGIEFEESLFLTNPHTISRTTVIENPFGQPENFLSSVRLPLLLMVDICLLNG